MLDDFLGEFARYRALGERSLAQLSDDALNHVPTADGNSAAMIVRHLSGNLASRFTDFLASDGEKPWRDREAEFATRMYTRDEVTAMWTSGFTILTDTLDSLTPDDLSREVVIRRQPLTVHAALCRSLSHLAYHVGQLVLLAREHAGAQWQSLSIARGDSVAYNAAPTAERGVR